MRLAPQRFLREHRPFLLLSLTLLIALSYPAIVYVFRTDVLWLPSSAGDLMMKIWDAWYGGLILAGEADFYHTDLYFHPHGLSLVYHNFNLPHMIVFGGLRAILPLSNAYSLTYLLFAYLTSLSAYIYLRYLFRDKWISAFGAVVLGMSGYVIGRNAAQPDTGFIATLPLSLYFLHRAVVEDRARFALFSGLLLGITAWMGMYVFVCIAISLGLYIVGFGISRWRSREYWLRIALLVLAASLISFPRIYPMMQDSQALDTALEKSWHYEDNDLLHYFINNNNPWIMRLFTNRVAQQHIDLRTAADRNTSYLGILPLLLIAFGFSRAAFRRGMLPWLALIAPFLLLRLGSYLTINGIRYESIPLPLLLLEELFPPVFKAFHVTDLFYAGVLLPLAVLACYGLRALLQWRDWRSPILVILALTGLIAFEHYRRPSERIVAHDEIAFVDALKNEEVGALINLPMNRGNSKFYGFHQTLHGYPHAEGLASRTPPQAYNFIDRNALLAAWRAGNGLTCAAENRADYEAALNQLLDAGFTHVILHFGRSRPAEIEASLAGVAPIYADDYAWIYRLETLRGACA